MYMSIPSYHGLHLHARLLDAPHDVVHIGDDSPTHPKLVVTASELPELVAELIAISEQIAIRNAPKIRSAA
jgi:hypothetical protein